jgi:short-subunit dehydrogenase
MELTRDRMLKEGARPAIIITGATSGIGKEIARLATLEDSFLLLIDERHRQLDELVAELTAQGARATGLAVDPASTDALQSIEHVLAEHDLYCDVLVNNGARALFGPAAGLATSEQISLIDLNVRGLAELTLRFVPEMVMRGRGGVINVGSIAGYMLGANMAVYAASKAFVNSFTVALATELAHTGVSVTCIAPGLGIRQFLQGSSSAPAWLLNVIPPPNAFDAALAAWLAFKTGQHVVIPKLTIRLVVIASRLLRESMLLRFLGALQPPAERA